MGRLKEVVFLQHVPAEDAGTIPGFLDEHQIPHRTIRLDRHEALPDTQAIAAAVILGGPMNVYEEEKYPFLKEETEWIGRALHADIPCLGICLGSQLIAKALGCRVYKAGEPEIGWQEICLTPAGERDALLGGLGATLQVLQWHEDTFDLPDGAELLASSLAVPNQAYRWGRAYGFQFHIEVNQRLLADWFSDHKLDGEILAEYKRYRFELSRITERIYGAFFKPLDAATFRASNSFLARRGRPE